jgi:uncharacterized protein
MGELRTPAMTAVPPALRRIVAQAALPRGPVAPSAAARQALRPLGSDAVTLSADGVLGGWQRRNAMSTLPHCIDQLTQAGALGNLRRSATDDRAHVGMWFSDSDVYKTLEAMAWRLTADADDDLVKVFDGIVDVIARAQDADGYINSFFQHVDSSRRWQELSTSHELYCAGHLIQAAVAAQRAGHGDRLMPIACRFADLIVDEFGPTGRQAVCGHPQIETALVEMYRETGHRGYLDTAREFILRRGRGLLGEGRFGAAYFQDHLPVAEVSEFTGHAVRQLYLLAGVVDVAVETGDDALLAAAARLWDSAFGSKTYVTGAHGSRHRDESVGDPFELPSDRAYAETCASIGSFQWNWRMLLATGASRYAHEMERVLYNAVAGATALDGRHFFYANPLHLRTGHDNGGEEAPSQRLTWYTCACCPPNLARLMASLHCYVATTDDDGLQIHQYTTGAIRTGRHHVDMTGDYPWHGDIALRVRSSDDRPWTLSLRVPGWCDAYEVLIDGVPDTSATVDGYLRLTRVWTGQYVELRLAMPARMIAPHPRIDAVRGCLALARGPLVYTIEQADLPVGTLLEDVSLDPAVPIEIHHHGIAADIPVTLTVAGYVHDHAADRLYQPYTGATAAPAAPPVQLPTVPYFLWGNRQPGPMRVWIPATTAGGPRDPEGGRS